MFADEPQPFRYKRDHYIKRVLLYILDDYVNFY